VTLPDALRRTRFTAIARPGGGLDLLANDQRESLRTLLVQARKPATDVDVTSFKVAVARALSPLASGALIDPLYGLDEILHERVLAPGCGLIVAVDFLIQEPGQPVKDTAFDASLPLDRFVAQGAAGLKLLVIWRRDGDRYARQRTVRDFVASCDRLGVLSVVEGIVREPAGAPEEWDRDGDIFDAAVELSRLGCDLYKAEVPTLGQGSEPEVERLSAAITAAIPCPWVVLSGGVDAERFPPAVRAACRGGASGFLAGRGIWGPSISAADPLAHLDTDAVARMRELIAIVDAHARPWTAAM
jgi:sulfofructosephosphate aldolase